MKNLLLLLVFFSGFHVFAQTDVIATSAGDLSITPVLHSSIVFQWDDKTVYIDPYGGAEMYENFPAPDLVLITDVHGDHLNPETLSVLNLENTELIAPQAVIDMLGEVSFKETSPLANGEDMEWENIQVEAIPMYNLPETDDSRHPKGRGNGYVITFGDKRVYISGDTEDIEEMRQLQNIDVAFVCMNLPYTMDVTQAADAVLDFKPAIVYPFHFRGGDGMFSDVEEFKKLVNEGNNAIDVRLRNWYPENN